MKSFIRWFALLLLMVLLAGCGPKASTPPKPVQRSDSSIVFRDVTSVSGLSWTRTNGASGRYWMPETMGGGGAFVDFDNDGYLDILLVNGDVWPGTATRGPRPTLGLFRSNRDGTFTDKTRETGLSISLQGMGAAVGDFDNDGWDDLYITAVGGNRLLRNVLGKRFQDVTAAAGVASPGWGTSAAWLDYDNDGRLDLFVCNYVKWTPATDIFCGHNGKKSYCRPQEYAGQSCRLFRNVDGHRFADLSRQAGIWNEESKALGVCLVDLDDDGRMDIVVSNDMVPNFVFHNTGHGFKEIGFETGISLDDSGESRAGMGIDSSVFSSFYRFDSQQGLAIGNFSYEGVAFYPLVGEGPYAERSRQAGIYGPSYPYVTFGLVFADLDNDMLPDLCITNGHIEDSIAINSPGQSFAQPCVLYRNLGDGRFADASASAGSGITRPVVGRGLCRGDFDNDGKVDLLLIPNIGPPRLLRNESRAPNHWLTLELTGTRSNRDGYGAKVTVNAGGVRQTAWCRSGSSYLSAHDKRLHFGLGMATKANSVSVRWPTGRTEDFQDLDGDRIYRIVEGTNKAEATSVSPK